MHTHIHINMHTHTSRHTYILVSGTRGAGLFISMRRGTRGERKLKFSYFPFHFFVLDLYLFQLSSLHYLIPLHDLPILLRILPRPNSIANCIRISLQYRNYSHNLFLELVAVSHHFSFHSFDHSCLSVSLIPVKSPHFISL